MKLNLGGMATTFLAVLLGIILYQRYLKKTSQPATSAPAQTAQAASTPAEPETIADFIKLHHPNAT